MAVTAVKKPLGCVEQPEHGPEPAQAPVESNSIRIEVRSTFVFMGPFVSNQSLSFR